MHRTWRSKELHCQSNKYQAASEAGKLYVFASPRPLSSFLNTLWTRSFRQFEFSKCKNGAMTAINYYASQSRSKLLGNGQANFNKLTLTSINYFIVGLFKMF